MCTEEWRKLSLDLGKEAACVFCYSNSINILANDFDN